MEAIQSFLETVVDALGTIIDFLEQGFEAIATFVSLQSQTFVLLNIVGTIIPPIVWGPVLSLICVILVLRVWKIVTSGD